MIDCNIQFITFPSGRVHEAVTVNEDNSITVFLDVRDSREMQEARFKHAMKHIAGEDFEKCDVQEIEYAAHEKRK